MALVYYVGRPPARSQMESVAFAFFVVVDFVFGFFFGRIYEERYWERIRDKSRRPRSDENGNPHGN